MSLTKPVLFLVVLAFGVACQKSPAAQNPQATPAKPAATAPASQTQPGQPAAPGQPQAAAAPAVKPVPAVLPETIARVNGEPIQKTEFENAVRELEATNRQSVPPERRNEIFRAVLDQMIAIKLVQQEGQALKLTVTDADVDARVKELQKQFPSEQAFTKALGDQHVTLAQLKANQRRQILVNKVLESQVASKVAVTPQDVEDFYKKNPDKFQRPESAHAQHILIRVPPNADAAAKAKAKAEAEAILKQVKGGADFAALAKEKSQDPGSAPGGGDLGFFGKGQMVPQFEEAAFKLKPGEVSPIVETPFGYHIIKMIERKPAGVVTLDEARPRIEEYLKGEQANQKTMAYIGQLKAKSKIEIYM